MKPMLTVAMMLLAATAAHADGACRADQIGSLPVSKPTAAGTPAGFLDTVRDHKAWYASHGLKDD